MSGMITEDLQLSEKLTNWSIQKINFLLSHIGDFVDHEKQTLIEDARQFSAQTGLDKVDRLLDGEMPQTELPRRVLERLAPFFDAGLVVLNGKITDIAWRGLIFELMENERIDVANLPDSVTPMSVDRAPAAPVLQAIGLPKLARSEESRIYVMRPAPNIALLWVSDLPDLWAKDHLAEALRLVNKAFSHAER